MKTREERRHPRRKLPGKLKLYWRTKDGSANTTLGKLVDISRSGALVELDRPIVPGTLVQVESASLRLAGVGLARYNAQRGLKWLVGLEFRGGLEWRESTPTGSTS